MGEGVRGGLMEIGGVRMEWERCMWRGGWCAWIYARVVVGCVLPREADLTIRFCFSPRWEDGAVLGGGARGLGPWEGVGHARLLIGRPILYWGEVGTD